MSKHVYKHEYIQWSLIVLINIVVSVMFAFDFLKSISAVLGMILAVSCFIVLYVKFDDYLHKSGWDNWSSSLKIGAFLLAVFQVDPMIHMMAGAAALDSTDFIAKGIDNPPLKDFTHIFSTVIVDGLLLSLIVVILAVIIRGIWYLLSLSSRG